jgi:hypothetical protein
VPTYLITTEERSKDEEGITNKNQSSEFRASAQKNSILIQSHPFKGGYFFFLPPSFFVKVKLSEPY